MEAALLSEFATLYALTYFGAITVVAVWEMLAPRRALTASLRVRWFGNISIYLVCIALWRLLIPVSAIGAAVAAQELGWGALNYFQWPAWVAFLLSVLALDLTRYGQHFALHRVPALWRLHRMHHTDQDYDFTTGLRFHPLEALLTVLIYVVAIVLVGAPPIAVLCVELLTTALAMLSHGNVSVPKFLDQRARMFVVTPDMHRVHHSALRQEHDSNLGIIFPWWDRLFGTYVAQPSRGHLGMAIGLPGYADAQHLKLTRMLIDPFVRAESSEQMSEGAADDQVRE